MKIAVAGIGYVGLANAVMLSRYHDVTITDTIKSKVDAVNDYISPIDDVDIKSALAADTLSLTASLEENFDFSPFPYVIIATPTNYDDETGRFDTHSVDSVIDAVFKTNREAVVVIRSTIPIGYTRTQNAYYKTDRIVFAPEFLREGKALFDCKNPSRIVVGGTSRYAVEFAGILSAVSEPHDVDVIITNSDEAESIKLLSNAYLAMRVSYFNEISTFAMIKKLDTSAIIRGICLDPRIGDGYNNPSFGYGGYCLPKDTKQLSADFEGVPSSLIGAIVEANEARKRVVAEELLKYPGVIGIYRLIMKSGSDNFRDSSVLYILKMLLEAKRVVIIYEPLLKTESFLGCPVIKGLTEFINQADIVAANRVTKELSEVKTKLFTCDIFGRD